MALITSNHEQVKRREPTEKKLVITEQVKTPANLVTRARVSPLARKMAQDLGLDLSKIKGSGASGTIHKSDIENYLKQSTSIDTTPKDSIKPPSRKSPDPDRMRGAIAAAMSKSNLEIPHYYLQLSINMEKSLEWMRQKNASRSIKERLLPITMLIKAMAKALIEVPQLNAYWKEGQLELQPAINIGFAISLRGGGLAIPAILNADLKSLDEIMFGIRDITQRTRSGKLTTSELANSTITLTSLGDRGVDTVFGVIYPPQVAIVGMGKISEQAWASSNMIGVQRVISVTLSGDHRATDGHLGGHFLETINNHLQQPETL